MRASRVLSGVILTAAAVAVSAPTALADDHRFGAASIVITPSVARAGGEVEVVVDCSAFHHPHPSPVFSKAFRDEIRLRPLDDRDGVFQGETTIGRDVDPGTYRVWGTCLRDRDRDRDRGKFMTTVEVTSCPPEHHEHGTEPEGAVHAGSGGTSQGMNVPETAGGAGLLASTALGGGLLVRRRRAAYRA